MDKHIEAPHYNKKSLECLARKILEGYDMSFISFEIKPIPIEDIIENHYNINLLYQYLSPNMSLLGLTAFEDGVLKVYDFDLKSKIDKRIKAGTILIESRLADEKQTGRYRFTCAHELSHYTAHKNYFEKMSMVASYNPNDDPEVNWLEWQANYMAAALLMPLKPLKINFYKNICAGISQEENISTLSAAFDVSKAALTMRLNDLKLI